MQPYEDIPSFYINIFQKPYNKVADCVKSLHNVNKIECDGDSTVMGYLHRRETKKITLTKGSDKILANYIRIFEPMVIKSLKVLFFACVFPKLICFVPAIHNYKRR